MKTSPSPVPTDPVPLYRCHECREDAELVITQRANARVLALYARHLRECHDCRRFDRRLRQLLERPEAPALPSVVEQTQEFARIMARVRKPEPAPNRWRLPVAVGGLVSVAAALLMMLLPLARAPHEPDQRLAQTARSPGLGPVAELSLEPAPEPRKPHGLEHRSQTFGRLVAGRGIVRGPDGATLSGGSFSPGTSFEATNDPLQVSLAGKLLAIFQPGSLVTWTNASPKRIELGLERGLLAIRYDRKEGDPTLLVHTPTGIVRVVGTVFTVEVDQHDDTIVSVLRGKVEVLDPESRRPVMTVDAGYRFHMSTSTIFDVGHREVDAALALSYDAAADDGRVSLADGRIPDSWVVPGLPDDASQRVLANVPDTFTIDEVRFVRPSRQTRYTRRRVPEVTPDEDEDDILRELIERAQRSIELAELRHELEKCRELYASAETRFLAADCLSKFLREFGDDPNAVEGRLLLGILRMDFAQDYQVAEVEFKRFLSQAPNHKLAELAVYKLWLAATENGHVGPAIARGKNYLRRYPNGRYVGQVLRRFPELKSEL
ncbi:MAG: hypothetical protein B7733_21930 [Myxococcales bacterium FL481]|nr:MAG: hypothetical protein B7733_21930 [Myxococcales bacterium FL481]